MTHSLPYFVAVAVVLGAGAVQERWTDRRAVAIALEQASARLDRIPTSVGEWSGSKVEMDRRGLERSGIVAAVARRYGRARDGAEVSVLIVCGRPGPIAAHGPEVCYAGAGYDRISPPARCEIATSPGTAADEFWASDFQNTEAVPASGLRIRWAWGAAGSWTAPDQPRLNFANNKFLYKLYIIQETHSQGMGPAGDGGLEFAASFLPELRPALFPKP